MQGEDERVAGLLTKAQREVLRILHPMPNGTTMVASANVTKAEPWPQGFATFYSYEWDLLTPLGLAVANIIRSQSND